MLKREGIYLPSFLIITSYIFKGDINMSSVIRLDKAIENMRSDIVLTNRIFSDELPDNIDNWYYYISIYANDEIALNRASKLLESLHVFARTVTIIPKTYKSCRFDCFSVSNIFSNIHSLSSYNIDTMSIIEQTDLEEGDFYISTIRQNKSTKLMDIMTYRSLTSYYT